MERFEGGDIGWCIYIRHTVRTSWIWCWSGNYYTAPIHFIQKLILNLCSQPVTLYLTSIYWRNIGISFWLSGLVCIIALKIYAIVAPGIGQPCRTVFKWVARQRDVHWASGIEFGVWGSQHHPNKQTHIGISQYSKTCQVDHLHKVTTCWCWSHIDRTGKVLCSLHIRPPP